MDFWFYYGITLAAGVMGFAFTCVGLYRDEPQALYLHRKMVRTYLPNIRRK